MDRAADMLLFYSVGERERVGQARQPSQRSNMESMWKRSGYDPLYFIVLFQVIEKANTTTMHWLWGVAIVLALFFLERCISLVYCSYV
jgi:hypothetical protein